MTRTHHDQFAKQCLEGFLSPFGETQISREMASEVLSVDVWFSPTSASVELRQALGLLGRMAETPCLIEAFRNRVQPHQVLDCQSKLNTVRNDLLRQAKSEKRQLSEGELPRLWILSPAVSKRVQDEFGAIERVDWATGIYFLANAQRVGLISIEQLPVIPETLWLRLLGRDAVQRSAIAELMKLPEGHPFRQQTVEQLSNLRITIETRKKLKQEERELIMALSPVYEQWQAETLQQGRREEGISLVMRLLVRKVGTLDPAVRSRIESLSLPNLEDLGEALLEFRSEADLLEWFAD